MARILQSGAEVGWSTTNITQPDGIPITAGSSTVTRETTIKRSGQACWKFASDLSQNTCYQRMTFTGIAECYLKVHMRGSDGLSSWGTGNETSLVRIFADQSDAQPLAEVRTDNVSNEWQLRVYTGGAWTIVSDNNIPLGNHKEWQRIELYVNQTSDQATLRVNGTQVANWTGTFTNTGNPSSAAIGCVATPGSSNNIYADDIVINDGITYDWPGDSRVFLLKPISDSQVGTWTGGVGGTTNLWDAVDNTPPIGTATETDTTQIEAASQQDGTTEYGATLQSAAQAGATPLSIIRAVQYLCCHGEDVATNTKTGSTGGKSGFSTTYQTFTFGNDVGLLGTWDSNWRWTFVPFTYPTGGTADYAVIPVQGVRKTDSGSRVGSVCFMGAYIETIDPTPMVNKPISIP